MQLIGNALRATIIAIGIAMAGVPTTETRAIAAWPRDSWYQDICYQTDCAEDKIVGVASWFDATRNSAWYTRKTEWGKAVKYYGAAGPRLRKFIESFYGTDIGGSAYWQRLAKENSRPVIRVTSKKTGESILVVVTDWCGCRGGKEGPDDDKIIDLAPEAFEALGMTLGVGVMKVTIEPVK